MGVKCNNHNVLITLLV